jgi:hypothetical protein
MKYPIVYLVFLLIIACQSEPKIGEKRLEEIRTEGISGNAAIIRNPITANGPIDTINVAKIKFLAPSHDFGEVEEGEVVRQIFEFENIGRVPLIIQDARSTCGCTVPEYPKNLIYPNQKGSIKVEFNTTNMLQVQRKPITIVANTYPSETKIYLNGYVHPKKEL